MLRKRTIVERGRSAEFPIVLDDDDDEDTSHAHKIQRPSARFEPYHPSVPTEGHEPCQMSQSKNELLVSARPRNDIQVPPFSLTAPAASITIHNSANLSIDWITGVPLITSAQSAPYEVSCVAVLPAESADILSQDDLIFNQFWQEAFGSAGPELIQVEKEAQTAGVEHKESNSRRAKPKKNKAASCRPLCVPAPPLQVPVIMRAAPPPLPLPKSATPTSTPPITTRTSAVPTAAPPLKAIVYFDGMARGSQGKVGAGYLLYTDNPLPPHVFPTEPITKAAVRIQDRSCNPYQAAYVGLIHGLREALDRGVCALDIYGNCEVVIKLMKREVDVKSLGLMLMNQIAQDLASNFITVTYNLVDSNTTNPANALSRRASRQPWTAEESADLIV